jgi:hypothetical protein
VWSVECGVWSVECGVWCGESGVWSVECGVRSVECGVWSVECGNENAYFAAVNSCPKELIQCNSIVILLFTRGGVKEKSANVTTGFFEI